jgi:hypothetical protein
MLYRGQRIDKKQTRIIENSSQPKFSQTFDFDLHSLIQSHDPMDNVNYKCDSFESSSHHHHANSSITIDTKIASRIQFLLLVMDWDRVEKSDVIGKIELNTQHHQQKLIHFQSIEKNGCLSSFPFLTDVVEESKIEKKTFFTRKPKLNKFMRLNEIETCVDDDHDHDVDDEEENSNFNQKIRKRRNTNESESHLYSNNTANNKQIETTSMASRQHNWYDIFYEPNVPIACTFQIDNF